ncbi:Crp/Fnr family transcriptional regulator [Lutibacter sp. HS1-25]|uniref:Crp/Fnr family transcriptional regulator n=1 Tax=Lutibacter sp. HS1-25 TaxID=2485000 RepID=UPI0010128021|nr:Crp/Fnr family transcriptional regulator [Lutibacter sp. HS1-25]RXP55130.1 Crp/Fnr family transcriptional regulator [Lutibacter sp. HS1-25]
MEKVWYLENVNLFKILCPHKYAEYKGCHNFKQYGKSDYIYFEEDASTKVFLIDKGKVKLGYYTSEGKEIVKAILVKGELFGEKAILGEDKRTEFAQSLDSNTSICPIGVNTLHDLMKDNQTFTLKIYKFISFRISKLERRLQILLFKDAKTRLLEFLDELCEEHGVICKETGGTLVEHPYTQKDIANLIGTSRPTLNLIMNEIKDEGLIEFKGKKILFLKKTA